MHLIGFFVTSNLYLELRLLRPSTLNQVIIYSVSTNNEKINSERQRISIQSSVGRRYLFISKFIVLVDIEQGKGKDNFPLSDL